MSGDVFYRVARSLGRPVIQVASRSRVLHASRVPREGPFLLMANHESVFDPMLLTISTPRVVRWLASRQLFEHPFGGWFYTRMRVRPVERDHRDTAAVRTILRDLGMGCAVGLFPQGAVREGSDLLRHDGRMPDRAARLAQLARVPVVPCVVTGGNGFGRWQNWLPLFRTRWAAAYGKPLMLRSDLEPAEARRVFLDELARAFLALYAEARAHA